MYSDMSRLIIADSSPNRNSASVLAVSVFPTPDGPRKMNEPDGRFGSFRPARVLRIGCDTALMASVWPTTRLGSLSFMRCWLVVSSSGSLTVGNDHHLGRTLAVG